MCDDDDPDANPKMDTSTCSHCVRGTVKLREEKPKVFPHCNFCNVCSLANCKSDAEDFRKICEDLECCQSTMLSVHNAVARLGKFVWTCTECTSKVDSHLKNDIGQIIDDGNTKDALSNAQRDNMLLKLNAESENMKKMMSNVLDILKESPRPAVYDLNSPARKSARITFPDDGGIPAVQIYSSANKSMKAKETYSDKVRMTVKKTADDSSNDLLKNLHATKSLIPSFTGKKKADGCVDILFRSFEDANKAKVILDENLANAVVNCPAPAKLSRYNFVGIPFEMNESEVVDAIVDENKHWMDLQKSANNVVNIKSDPFSCIHVHSVTKCKNGGMYRAVVSVSANMLASLGNRRLSVGYVKCKLYQWKTHRRCYRCQIVGHYAGNCNRKIACSKCSGEHFLRDCKSDCNKCVNCTLNKREDTDHPSSSPLCPFNNIMIMPEVS